MTLREHNGDIIFKKGSIALRDRLKRQIPILHLQTIFLWIENVIPLRVRCYGSEILVTINV